LVTGGSGFIGSNIVKLLIAQGHTVRVLDNLLSGYRENLTPFPDIEYIKGDVRDTDTVHRAAEGVEVIFHLAASVGNKRSIDHPIEDSQINVIGTLNVLEAARKNAVRKVVYSSSAGIFGELKTLPIAEDHIQDPDSPYGVSKLAAEKHALAYNKLYDLEVVCLRYFNVYGLNQRYDAYGNVIPIFAHRMLNNEPVTIFGDGEQTRDFINVRDIALANYKAAITTGKSGVYNLGSGTQITINKLVELMSEVSGIKPEIVHGPQRPGDVRDSRADITAAAEAFGFEPTVDLRDGLREYMQFARTIMT